MEDSSYLDGLLFDSSVESEGVTYTDCEVIEQLKLLMDEVNKEYRKYVISEILVSCYKDIPRRANLVPKVLSNKLKRIINNMELLESMTMKDKNGTKHNILGLKDDDLLKLKIEELTPIEQSCLKSAVNMLLHKKCKTFRDKQIEVEKECNMMKCRKTEVSHQSHLFGKMDQDLKSVEELTQKTILCQSLIHSISEIQQKCLQVENKWKDIIANSCANVEAKTELLCAESRLLYSKVVNSVCSENENFLKAIELLQSALQKEIEDEELELKMLNEKLQAYETAEKDEIFKTLVKTYNKIRTKHKHLNWCLESMHEG